jgi:SAM-dependent methyltransferase
VTVERALWVAVTTLSVLNILLALRGRGAKTWLLRRLRPETPPMDDDSQHPERLAVLPYCVGRGIDVGCGYRKTTLECIGVDIVPRGEPGRAGSVAGRPSAADICASGDALTMFQDGELDFVVARHNLEHYVDPVKALQEWKRVLRPGGALAVLVPDERALNTIALDPTHKHVFTPESLTRLVKLIGGLRIVKVETVVADWSFLCACEREDG